MGEKLLTTDNDRCPHCGSELFTFLYLNIITKTGYDEPTDAEVVVSCSDCGKPYNKNREVEFSWRQS
jgi:uncharacterized protein with PIN domain